MAQVARCSHCGTAWRVVSDQFKVSDGWLRCGACQRAFDAAFLRDPHILPRDEANAPTSGLPLLQERAAAPASAEVQSPSFMAPADRRLLAAPWTRQHLARTLMLLLALVLCGVALLWQRDRIAVWSPAVGDALKALCAQLACNPHARRDIDAIVIEQSDLVRIDGQQLELQVTIANASRLPVLLPALELTLIDEQGKTLWQRVLQADELVVGQTVAAGATALRPSQALTLRKTVAPELPEAPEAPVRGYRLLALYP